jgi:hypothetical protein
MKNATTFRLLIYFAACSVIFHACIFEEGAQGTEATEDAGSDVEFTKPSQSEPRRDIYEASADADDFPFESGVHSTVQGRPHMRSNRLQTGHWLYQGEHFVLDGRITLFGRDEPQPMKVVVLLDFEPVQFRLEAVHARDAYPTMTDIAGSTASFELSSSHELVSGQPFNYTLIIPPEAFGDASAYDLRILHLPEFEPSNTALMKAWAWAMSRAMTVYYNGRYFHSDAPTLTDATFVSPPNEVVEEFLFRSRGPFLVPPTELYDLEALSHPDEAMLAQMFETDEATVRLDAYTAGSRRPSKGGRNYYLLFDGTEPLSRQGGVTTTRAMPDVPGTGDDYLRHFSLEVPLEVEHEHALTLVRFPSPYEKMDELPSPLPANVLSQTLFFRRNAVSEE